MKPKTNRFQFRKIIICLILATHNHKQKIFERKQKEINKQILNKVRATIAMEKGGNEDEDEHEGGRSRS